MNFPPIEVYDEIGSTNAELMARGRADAPHGVAVRARVQTAGRGQRAHGWASPDGGLYLSVLLRPNVSPYMLPGLPVVCALGILRALRSSDCSRAQLKWPNDVVVEGRKLAGILVELGTSNAGTYAVCGVGVNMHVPQLKRGDVWQVEHEGFLQTGHGQVGSERAGTTTSAGPAALPPAGLIDALDDVCEAPSLDDLAERVRAGILSEVNAWEQRVAGAANDAPLLYGLADAYNAALAFVDEPVHIYAIDGDLIDQGIFKGVDSWGHAVLQKSDGTRIEYDAVAVSLRPAR